MQPVALTIERDVYTALVRAARRATPLEACGLCGGAAGHVTRFYELTNVDASPEHFGMRPEDQFAAVKDMRARPDAAGALAQPSGQSSADV